MAAGQAAEWGLSWYFQWGRQTSIPTWIDAQNLEAVAEAPRSLKIFVS